MPLIGVTTYYSDARWAAWHRPAAVVPAAYFELVAAVRCPPLLLPPVRTARGGPAAGAAEVVGALDALVLVGGADLDPASHGQAPHPSADLPDPVRDEAERALLVAALDVDLPVLAICRGLQVLNVLFGGSLHQYLPEVTGSHAHQPAARGVRRRGGRGRAGDPARVGGRCQQRGALLAPSGGRSGG